MHTLFNWKDSMNSINIINMFGQIAKDLRHCLNILTSLKPLENVLSLLIL